MVKRRAVFYVGKKSPEIPKSEAGGGRRAEKGQVENKMYICIDICICAPVSRVALEPRFLGVEGRDGLCRRQEGGWRKGSDVARETIKIQPWRRGRTSRGKRTS